jgi:uncharacterized protein (DUF302 family)
MAKSSTARWIAIAVVVAAGAGCSDPEPVTLARYAEPDRLFSMVEANVQASGTLEKIVEIDHSRLGAEAGSVMPPARVLIFSNPALDAELLARNPLVAIDLPLRILAYETVSDGEGRVIFNSFDYLRSRYELGDLPELLARYDSSIAEALQGIDAEQIAAFPSDEMQPDGITTIESPFDLETTIKRLSAAIDAQDDTVWFGKVDFQARAKEQGMVVAPAIMLLFGGPAPGAKAMAKAPTLGLDAFCQKLLVWQSETGAVQVSWNDLLALAERQGVPKSPALRVINHRLKSTFESALEAS